MTTDPRLHAAIELVHALGAGDYAARAPSDDRDDEVGALLIGLNMLAEDLGSEHALRQQAEKLLGDAMEGYEHAPAMLLSVELPSLRVLRCNATTERALGRPRTAILDGSFLEMVHPDSRARAHEIFGPVTPERSAAAREIDIVDSKGKRLRVDVATTHVDDGGVPRARLSLRDVTEQRSLEAQLLHAQKMESIGRLAGGVAHDLNNILLVIQTAASLLSSSNEIGDREEMKAIVLAAERAETLTRQLLAFSRRQAISPRIVELGGILESQQRLLERVLGEDIELVVDHEQGLGQVHADPAQLEQIVLNLALNARDAMPRGGRLTIETRNTMLDDEYASRHLGVSAGAYVMIAVSDTGCGIAPEIRDRIFEPFFTTKEPGRGTGLGLAMVYGAVQQAKGSIWVYSEVGRGTTFKIYLPRVQGPVAVPDSLGAANKSVAGRERVLLVEDDPYVRALTARLLREAGYSVSEAADGPTALDLAAGGAVFDLVLTDVVMPGMDGRAMVERLRARGMRPRVLYVSGYTANIIVHHGVVEARVNFLPKPYTPSVLLSAIRNVLDAPNDPK